MPESLLSAAKKVAAFSDLSWTDVSRVYGALQAGDRAPALPPAAATEVSAPGLPKSSGRNVWYAHPNFIARLLLGLAGRAATVDPWTTVKHFHDALPEQKAGADAPEQGVDDLEFRLATLLRNPKLADEVTRLEFNPEAAEFVLQHPTLGGRFRPASSVQRAAFIYSQQTFSTRVAINPLLLQKLAAEIDWRPESFPPYRGADAPESAE